MSDWAEIVRIIAEIVEGGVSADDAYVRLERLPDVLRTNLSVTLIDPSSDIAADDLQGLIASGLIMAAESTLSERRREAGPHLG